MSFEKDGQLMRFFCDICETTVEVQSHSFLDAWEFFREKGWRAFKTEDGEWEHRCPDCVGES